MDTITESIHKKSQIKPETKKCRFCDNELNTIFADLGMSPLSNAYVSEDHLHKAEAFYPLVTYVCTSCFLVQLLEYETPDTIFSDYAYFSSYSDSWLEHSKKYVDMICGRVNLDQSSHVVELASNDGYLLQYFQEKKIPVLGIEPAENVAQAAIEKGIPTVTKFFGQQIARELLDEGKPADLIVGNNVLAHVPDINDFVGGMKILLKPDGVITMEFPHLLRLIIHNQFDTIYHEHFSYLSLYTVEKIFNKHGLKLFDVEELSTHGGSLRIYATHADNDSLMIIDNVDILRNTEEEQGLTDIQVYLNFTEKVKKTKRNLLQELVRLKGEGKKIVGYGAAAKGNTLLTYCGIRIDFIDYVVDRNPHKAGKYLPGTRIPIKHPDSIKEDKPDYLFILPWNIKDEIISQNHFIREWGGKFIIPIPSVHIID